jgi:hypothetical protein
VGRPTAGDHHHAWEREEGSTAQRKRRWEIATPTVVVPATGGVEGDATPEIQCKWSHIKLGRESVEFGWLLLGQRGRRVAESTCSEYCRCTFTANRFDYAQLIWIVAIPRPCNLGTKGGFNGPNPNCRS